MIVFLKNKLNLGQTEELLKKLTQSGFFHIFGSGTLVQIVTFLSNIILINIVAKDIYGLFTYAANIYNVIMLISGLGSDSTMLQLASESYNDKKKRTSIYQFALRFGLLANLVLAFIVIAVANVYPFEINGAQILIYLYVGLPIIQFLNTYQAIYLRCERNNKGYSILNLTNAVLLMLFSIIGALSFDAAGFIIAQYFSAGIVVMIAVKRYEVPLFQKCEALSFREKREFVKYSLTVSIGNAFSQIKTLASALVLGLVLPNAELLASYNVALKIPVALLFIPSMFCVYLYPYFAENINNVKWCIRYYKLSTLGIFFVNLIITLIAIFFAEPLIGTFFGSEYLDSIDTFRILMINFLIAGTFNTLPGNLLGAQRKFAYNLGVNIFTGSLNILLCAIFISRWASIGAAIAILATTIISSILYVGGLLNVYRKKLNKGDDIK